MDIDLNLLHRLFRAHPWHGVSIGDEAPDRVTAYIEIVPTDTVKYELDKATGLLKVDRPQKFSNVYPTLYGLIPQTLCGPRSAELCMEKASIWEAVFRRCYADNEEFERDFADRTARHPYPV